MASILKGFKARRLEVDEDEQLEVVEEEEGWAPQDELIDVKRQASNGHMTTFSDGTLASEERVRLQLNFVYGADVIGPCMEASCEELVAFAHCPYCDQCFCFMHLMSE
ncbi:unnamed protein product [Heligmosomoides polygyrus]|uniref:Transp_Tc5_C domain-containing protein n=1 Tax=Heligmosomoides polygyrus TaxID=6339 RepID=A0A183GND3_HELPZ|nr:unnamed protein product [Heligmosomoides polygyrus]